MLDGLIVGGIAHPELIDDLVQLKHRGVAVVTIHELGADPRVVNVWMDQVEVSKLATEHLIERGCRRIAHICVQDSGGARFQGYQTALIDNGIPFRPELVCGADDYTAAQGEQAIRTLLEAQIAFDGLVAQSDHQAVGALNTLLKAGRSVPQDVRIIGVDDAPFCELSIVPLSSVSQEFRERGKRAVRLLIDKMNGKPVSSITISPKLRRRESSI